MKKMTLRFLFGAVVIVAIFYFFFRQDITGSRGRMYSDKKKMCAEFAQSYLRTIQKIEPGFNDQKWQMAIDIETEIFKLCSLNLNAESLKDYKPTALEKYQKE